MALSFVRILLLPCVLILLSACAQLQQLDWPWPSTPAAHARRDAERSRPASRSAASSAPRSATTEPPSSANSYAEGMRFYRAGQYDDALASFAQVQSPTALRVQALKYSAFSYCVTNRLSLCEQAFQQLLALSPQFRLNAAEQGHPIWDPVFRKAQRAQSSPRSRQR